VELDKAQVAALGRGSVKVLRGMQTHEKFFTNMFVSVQQQC